VLVGLTQRFGELVPAGAGAWSTAFRFCRDDTDLIVRVGQHVADFRLDEEMATYSRPGLPIPSVANTVVTGVFDWGCRRWGDHLYDLAWFEFWAPWHRNLDIDLLRRAMTHRWGEAPDADRWAVSLVHIGIDHLVYNAVINDEQESAAVLARMHALELLTG